MDFRLGIVIAATLLLVITVASPDPSDHFCASFSDTHEPCGCTIFQRASYNPVCGSDGLTYLNECYMACRNIVEGNGSNIYVVHSGACHEGCSCKCKGIYDPICGTDGITYSNRCTLKCTQEKQNSNIRFEHSGECDAGDKSRERRKISTTEEQEEFGPFPSPAILRSDCRYKIEQRRVPLRQIHKIINGRTPELTSVEAWTLPMPPDEATWPDESHISFIDKSKELFSSTTKALKRPSSTSKEPKRPSSTTKKPKRPSSTTKEPKRPSSTTKKPKRPSSTTKPAISPSAKCLCSAVYIPVCGKKGDNKESFINFCAFFCMTKKNPKIEFAHWGMCV